MNIRFGQIKRGERFLFKGKLWERSRHGCFGVPVDRIGIGHTGVCFSRSDLVGKIEETKHV